MGDWFPSPPSYQRYSSETVNEGSVKTIVHIFNLRYYKYMNTFSE